MKVAWWRWTATLSVLALYSACASCTVCNNHTVYEVHQGGVLQLGEALMQPPPHQSNSQDMNDSPSQSCVNFSLSSGVYSIDAGISVLGDSVVITGIGDVVLQIGQNMSSPGKGPGSPGLQFRNNGYVEITGVEIDGSSGPLTFEDIGNLVIKSSTFR